MNLDFIKDRIVAVPDFPKPGIVFRDITPLLADPQGLKMTAKAMAEELKSKGIKPTVIAGTESRGFIFGVALAEVLGLGFVPVRKPGKLPRETYKVSYQLEYGSDSLEIHKDAFKPTDKVLVVDDLLATGGTAKATVQLIEKTQASVAGLIFVIELEDLNGRKVLEGHNVSALVKY
ncbi:adenine phosphoribosyltransferase [Francisella philomiragia]|uniref:Adenine phosphoribosyltransferase n=1 Tax=Francisella philomiragia subsp. philomiragia (strain ATCC 25017 / CCUG 19701 / FSC 153 / O\|nr:adenine phosphoribosyltransferase [Francisella philomiragia]B0TWU0.1 RecName: Full=Adenine phosphoribosyltransferase; Short=APRT [Francisella philomiragia subsp. philomiragia ATCC 25017]AJI48042.1 adenine phosphoribosyltransferase [Francisella philomiragia]AJI49405.1 adenine phosphoribosyltransferase [Francisella philomiragia]MBK2021567.1 adenine phosphoribosyltransferase [Francisella philomiragia]MBK2030607.1 adenine phosphoribosyltransferase [Francisella philomiragia]MBK2263918.1 adenine